MPCPLRACVVADGASRRTVYREALNLRYCWWRRRGNRCDWSIDLAMNAKAATRIRWCRAAATLSIALSCGILASCGGSEAQRQSPAESEDGVEAIDLLADRGRPGEFELSDGIVRTVNDEHAVELSA